MEEKTSPTSPEALQDKNSSNSWKELFKLVVISIVIVIPFRLFIAQPFIVEGASMEPTFDTGEYLIVDEFSYRFKNPERGDIMVFKYPADPSKSFIKRVIGLPGEKISIKDGLVTIISSEYPRGFTLEESYVEFEKIEDLSYVLDQGEYFVMGDNRSRSADSRLWGAVPEENIVGRPIIRFFPPEVFPGRASFVNTSL
jgi:signal peptidase I